MSGTVIGKNMNLGYAGKVSRDADLIVMHRTVKSTSADIPFGAAVILNSDNTYTLFGATGTNANFGGIAVASVKQATSYDNTEVAYKANEGADVVVRGTATIKCSKGTPTAGGKVYLRVLANATFPTAAVGDWEAESDTTNTIEITDALWTTGYVDANGVSEVTLITRVNA